MLTIVAEPTDDPRYRKPYMTLVIHDPDIGSRLLTSWAKS